MIVGILMYLIPRYLNVKDKWLDKFYLRYFVPCKEKKNNIMSQKDITES
jgi:hypothetical protein